MPQDKCSRLAQVKINRVYKSIYKLNVSCPVPHTGDTQSIDVCG